MVRKIALSDFFTEFTLDNTRIWTAGFLNERFAAPVSPLGWTLIRDWFEELALRGPLRYLGVEWPAAQPLTRLYHGHPYADAQAFWTLYKLFPDAVLPEDAARYFPDGRIALRRTVPQPAGFLDLRLWSAVGRSMLADLSNWSPWHNWRAWGRFETRLVTDLRQRTEALDGRRGPIGRTEIWAALQEAQVWTRQLLSLHRWSLTHADLSYTLLRRLLRCTANVAQADEWSARLTSGVPNLSLNLDAALTRLATRQRSGPRERFEAEFAAFIGEHGHRSFGLDIVQPPFAAEPETALGLLNSLREATEFPDAGEQTWIDVRRATGRLARPLLRQVLSLARVYMGLREDQRYRWQQILALMRRLILQQAEDWVDEGRLDAADDVFFVTWAEFSADVREQAPLPDRRVIHQRREQFADLRREYYADPCGHYPAFLQGDAPCAGANCVPLAANRVPSEFWGRAASPGLARGPVRRVIAPGELAAVEPGAVLLARATDPGWTPVFRRVAALVTETGGLLSHGAVVAREYGLPAVVSATGAFEGLHDGQWVEVDGRLGKVSVLSQK
jgi:phosphohistidine swiveling domain-containing protein